ncbi:cholesterol 7-alpha-monooxygenase [Plakobranchus ocellatus]|uniref:Cholesterol 7-alpha-monooxygenase n=1 Tax=Plakobranchus ocellatus TaxID=259542 RepID=A0AAV4DLV4_9GAST|nr:cholesterol 7-alpha-monooxygenase [Plakobranchus ocellatus]
MLFPVTQSQCSQHSNLRSSDDGARSALTPSEPILEVGRKKLLILKRQLLSHGLSNCFAHLTHHCEVVSGFKSPVRPPARLRTRDTKLHADFRAALLATVPAATFLSTPPPPLPLFFSPPPFSNYSHSAISYSGRSEEKSQIQILDKTLRYAWGKMDDKIY